MGIYAIKPAFRSKLTGLRDALVRAGVSADALTWLALVLSVLGGASIAFSQQWPYLLLAIPPLAMGRITLNALDGMVATHTGTAKPSGELFNELSDRFADAAFFAGVALASDALLATIALAIALGSSYAGVLAKAAGGERNYGGVFGKADRMILLSVASVTAYLFGSEWLARFSIAAIVLGTVTIAQRIVAALRELRAHAS